MKSLKPLTPLLCLTLVGAVLLGGVHAKDLVGVLPILGFAAKKTVSDDSSTSVHKVTPDLHTHVEKAGKSMSHGPDGNQLADGRSLRLAQRKHRARLHAN